MRKVKLTALLIKQSEYSESSLIFRFYTREHGLIGVLAKGIRKQEKPLPALCEYELNAYEPKEQGLWLFAEASLTRDLSSFPATSTWAAAESGIELVSQIISAPEDIPQLYDLTLSYLEYLQKTPRNAILILWRFILRITILSGIGNPLETCCLCKKRSGSYTAYLSNPGGLICRECAMDQPVSDNLLRLSALSAQILYWLPEIANHLQEIKLSPQTVQEINAVFEQYWQAHHKHPLHLRSLGVLSQFQF